MPYTCSYSNKEKEKNTLRFYTSQLDYFGFSKQPSPSVAWFRV